MKLQLPAVLALALSLQLLASCSDAPDEALRAVSRDSAGVRIVTNPDQASAEWTIDTVPFLEIGSVEGAEGQDLALPWSSLRLPDGRVAVSNARTNELRLYSPQGDFVRAAGGSGEGPGEFGLIAAVHLTRGDTIVAADARYPRLNLFDSDAVFGRAITLSLIEGGVPRLRGLVQDTLGVYRATFYGRSGGASGAVRDTFLLAVRPFDGDSTQVLGRFLAEERFSQIMPNGAVAGWDLPFGRDLYTAIASDVIWVGQSDDYEIRGFGPEGALKTLVRLDRPVTPVDDELRNRHFEHQLAGAEDADQRRIYLEVQEIIEFPPTLPAYSSLKVDARGNLWVEEYQLPWVGAAPLWRVFDSAGRTKAVVRMPRGLTVHEIGDEYVMGMWRDDLGVEYIRFYSLARDK